MKTPKSEIYLGIRNALLFAAVLGTPIFAPFILCFFAALYFNAFGQRAFQEEEDAKFKQEQEEMEKLFKLYKI